MQVVEADLYAFSRVEQRTSVVLPSHFLRQTTAKGIVPCSKIIRKFKQLEYLRWSCSGPQILYRSTKHQESQKNETCPSYTRRSVHTRSRDRLRRAKQLTKWALKPPWLRTSPVVRPERPSHAVQRPTTFPPLLLSYLFLKRKREGSLLVCCAILQPMRHPKKRPQGDKGSTPFFAELHYL